MRTKERRDTGQTDLLSSQLDAIIDMGHPLVKLAATSDRPFPRAAVWSGVRGQAGPTAVDAADGGLGHLFDEVLCDRWVENLCYQFFCGEEFFEHRLVFDRSSLTRWSQRIGEERLQGLAAGAPGGCHQDRGDQPPR